MIIKSLYDSVEIDNIKYFFNILIDSSVVKVFVGKNWPTLAKNKTFFYFEELLNNTKWPKLSTEEANLKHAANLWLKAVESAKVRDSFK